MSKKPAHVPREEQAPSVIEHASPEAIAEVIKRAKETPPGMAPSLHPLTPDQALLVLLQAGQLKSPK